MRRKIMVIDDEEPVRKTIRLQLSGTAYEIVEAANGKEGIDLLNSGDNPLTVDLIICDIRMPEINGKEAIKYFRREYRGTPIIVLTGYPDVQLAVNCIKRGVCDYIVKPVEKEHLIAAVEKALKQRTVFE